MDRIIGRHPVVDALKQDKNLERVYIQDSISGEFEKEVRALCKQRNIPLNRIPKAKLDREVKGNHQGIYALATQINYLVLPQLIDNLKAGGKNPVILLLDGVQDVRNLGAIARSAEVFGVNALVIPSKKMAALNEVAIKTSAGALLHLPTSRVKNLQLALDYLGANGFIALGAEAEGGDVLADIDLNQPLALIIGAEGKGIDRHLKIYCDHLFSIPQVGKIQSLNVSVAAGIILYEIFKLRKQST